MNIEARNLLEELPMPACGTKSITGCYDCKQNETCEFIQALIEKQMYMGTCPICSGKTLIEEITSSNPYAMSYCVEENCDYRCNQFMSYEDFKELEIF